MLKTSFRLLDGLERKFRRDGGKDIKFPREVLSVRPGGHFELNEVTDRRGDHGLIIFKILGVTGLPLFFEFTEGFR